MSINYISIIQLTVASYFVKQSYDHLANHSPRLDTPAVYSMNGYDQQSGTKSVLAKMTGQSACLRFWGFAQTAFGLPVKTSLRPDGQKSTEAGARL